MAGMLLTNIVPSKQTMQTYHVRFFFFTLATVPCAYYMMEDGRGGRYGQNKKHDHDEFFLLDIHDYHNIHEDYTTPSEPSFFLLSILLNNTEHLKY